jgi:anti-sigma B factor antagonist
MSDLLTVSTSDEEGFVHLRFEGNLDTSSSPQAQEALNGAIEAGATKLLVDFESLDFVSSAGLRVLLATAKSLGRLGGAMHICSLNETVDEVFEISGFSTIFNVFKSRDEAVAAF